MQILQMVWIVGSTCPVHYEAVKKQRKDGGCLYVLDNKGKYAVESDREAGSRGHLGLS